MTTVCRVNVVKDGINKSIIVNVGCVNMFWFYVINMARIRFIVQIMDFTSISV